MKPAGDEARPAGPVLRTGTGGVTLRLDASVQEWLTERRIFFGRTRLGFRGLRSVRIPARARVEPYACFPAGDVLFEMGAFSYSETGFDGDISLGRYCSVARGVKVMGVRHPLEWVTTSSVTYDIHPDRGYASFAAAHRELGRGDFPAQRPAGLRQPGPSIGHDVWIGEDALLGRGIRIGTGSVVASGAIVTKDVEPYTIVGGAPARVIRRRFDEALSERLLASRWWEYGPDILRVADYRDPLAFVEAIEARTERPEPLALTPVTAEEALARFATG